MSRAPRPRRALRVLPRRLMAAVLSVTLTVGVAGAADRADGDDLPDPAAFTRDGATLEQVLDEAGYGAAWRAATGLSGATRHLDVSYVDGRGEAPTQLVATVIERDNVAEAHEQVIGELRAAADELALAIEDERQAQITRNRADAHLRGVLGLLQAVALELFEGAYGSDNDVLGFDGARQTAAFRNVEITALTLEEMLARKEAAEIALAEAEAALADAAAATASLTTEHARLGEEAAALALSRARLEDEARQRIPDAADAFALARTTTERNLTPRALESYISAEQTMTLTQPGCGITWRTIAAVAAVESSHGAYDGRWLTMEGTADRPIIGLRLDGNAVDNFGSRVAAIADTDNGRWDGDRQFDRAIGPLQFIPQSWSRWARDGDGDGETDPYDIDDAALTAAAYLCAYGSHRSWDNWSAAIFGYNHSIDYVNSVKASFDRIQRIRITDPETGPRLQPPTPNGVYVPPPDPEQPEEGGPLPGPGDIPLGELPPAGPTPVTVPPTTAPSIPPAGPTPVTVPPTTAPPTPPPTAPPPTTPPPTTSVPDSPGG